MHVAFVASHSCTATILFSTSNTVCICFIPVYALLRYHLFYLKFWKFPVIGELLRLCIASILQIVLITATTDWRCFLIQQYKWVTQRRRHERYRRYQNKKAKSLNELLALLSYFIWFNPFQDTKETGS